MRSLFFLFLFFSSLLFSFSFFFFCNLLHDLEAQLAKSVLEGLVLNTCYLDKSCGLPGALSEQGQLFQKASAIATLIWTLYF